jgi:hypothetical protein
MRAWLIAALLLQFIVASGQSARINKISLDEALVLTYKNNPTATSDSARKKLSCDLKSAWHLLLYKINKQETLQAYQQLLGDLERVAVLHYQSGNIEYLEKSSFIRKLAEIKTTEVISENEIDMANNLIGQLLFTNEEFAPVDSALNMVQINKTRPYERSPGIGQTIDEKQDSLVTRYKEFIVLKTIENKQMELDGIFMKLQYFYSWGLEYADTILRTSHAKYKAEDIDYLEYADKISEAFSIKLEYLETLNNYNQKAIMLEYYAY